MTNQATTTAPSPTLAQLLRFTAQDLSANRDGQLSAAQLDMLRTRRLRSVAIGAVIVLVMVFVATLFIFMGGRGGGSVILTIIGIGVTICGAAVMGAFARYWLRLSADINGGMVQTHRGQLERIIKPVTRRVLNYVIRVDEAEVFVPREAFVLFQHGGDYAIYRAPHTGLLLSVERLDK